MPEVREITIKIQAEGGSDEWQPSPNPEPSPTPEKQSTNTAIRPIKSSDNKTLAKSVLLNQAFQVAKNSIIRSLDFNITRYLDLKEDYLSENDYNAAKATIQTTATFATSVFIGAKVGSVGGPVGALIGGAIGAVGGTIANLQGYRSLKSSVSTDLNGRIIQTNFARERAGLTNEGKGTEN